MSDKDNAPSPPPALKDAEMQERLSALDAKIRRCASGEKDGEKEGNKHGKGLALAYRVVIEIVAGFLVGYFLGKMLDNILETAPVLTIICLLLGMSGAFVNIYRAALRSLKDNEM